MKIVKILRKDQLYSAGIALIVMFSERIIIKSFFLTEYKIVC